MSPPCTVLIVRLHMIDLNIVDDYIQDAKNDLWSQERYRLLTIIHKSCDKLNQTVQETGDLAREVRRIEDRISQLRMRQAAIDGP